MSTRGSKFFLSVAVKCVLWGMMALIVASCASIMKYDKADSLKTNSEFEQIVKIETPPVAETAAVTPPPAEATVAGKKATANKSKSNAKKLPTTLPKKKAVSGGTPSPAISVGTEASAGTSPATAARQPELEDREGFAPGSRRPLKDPYRVGEVLTHSVNYFKVQAGELKLKVEPFAQVNGKKAYTFVTEIRSSSVFSSFYSVEDRVETFVDYEELVPRTYALHVKESSQLREARSFFDFDKGKATFWEKKVTKKDGEEEKKLEWDLDAYSQNVFSAVFYMRVFKWDLGKEYAFRVSDDRQNMVFKGKAIRKEKLNTAAGVFDAVVIKPEITLKGVFKPVGDIFIWLSDDEHKYVLRIESKIKIGTLVSEIIKIEPGK